MFMPDQKMVERTRVKYPAGTRIMLDCMMDDPRPVEPGTTGTVDCVDDAGTIHVKFDNGRYLGVIPGVDSFRVIGGSANA